MRTFVRGLTVATVAALTVMVAPGAASAAPDARPTLEIVGLTGPSSEFGEPEWWLEVVATDPDGSIWEVEVRFGDNSVTWASTFCLQGTEPGQPARLLIPHSYAEPGSYVVRARAESISQCYGGADVTWQTSAWVVKRLTAAA